MEELPKVILLANKMEPSNFANDSFSDESYLLVVFQTALMFSYDGENYFNIPENSAIIYKPYARKTYKSNGTILLNSFMNVYVNESYFSKYNLVFNTLFTITKEAQEKLVFEMDRLSYIVNTPYAQTILNKIPYYVDKIFSIVDEALKDTSKTFITSNIISNFINVRAKLYQDPVTYSVEKMASTLGFTETYFGIKYKEFFNVTPSYDRKIRIVELIKNYLETTDYSLETIGDFCKIQSTAHLINLFKSITNITPHQYRKKYRNKQ